MEQRKVGTAKINVKDLNLFYGEKQALFGVILIFDEKSYCINRSFRLW